MPRPIVSSEPIPCCWGLRARAGTPGPASARASTSNGDGAVGEGRDQRLSRLGETAVEVARLELRQERAADRPPFVAGQHVGVPPRTRTLDSTLSFLEIKM